MAIYRRKTSKGLTEYYHYRFVSGGKDYHGVCEGCADEASAREFERKVRETVAVLATQRNVKALVENFRDELAGGEGIPLKEAFARAMDKPRRREAAEAHMAAKRSQFGDFVAFMGRRHPEVMDMRGVTEGIAGEYVQHLRTNGRFDKRVSFRRRPGDRKAAKYRGGAVKMSPTTVNRYHKTCREVFGLLMKDAGLPENPFAGIPMLSEKGETREAFTDDELELIFRKADPFVRAIFIVGMNTALREEDIATLRWSDVDWRNGMIKRLTMKTKTLVEIPIMPELETFLRQREAADSGSEYVLAEHAEMYHGNRTGISYRVKKFLESIGIRTTRKVEGRTRAVSVKDVHSLRHTFCYIAGLNGIPMVVVQSIVGHMTAEMTRLYMSHADLDAKRRGMMRMKYAAGLPEASAAFRRILVEQSRRKLVSLVQNADDKTVVRLANELLPKKARNAQAMGRP